MADNGELERNRIIMKLRSIVATVLGVGVAVGVGADEGGSWLQLVKSKTGFRFEGVATDGKFSFDVPGESIRTSQDGDRAMADIDHVLVQVMRATPEADGVMSAVASYAAKEKAWVASAGATIAPSRLCESMSVAHEEWQATMPNGASSLFLVTPLGRDVIVVASDPAERKAARKKMRAVCATYQS
jgi:hypothetical protein